MLRPSVEAGAGGGNLLCLNLHQPRGRGPGRAAASRHCVRGSHQELLAEDSCSWPADSGGCLPEVCASLRPDFCTFPGELSLQSPRLLAPPSNLPPHPGTAGVTCLWISMTEPEQQPHHQKVPLGSQVEPHGEELPRRPLVHLCLHSPAHRLPAQGVIAL